MQQREESGHKRNTLGNSGQKPLTYRDEQLLENELTVRAGGRADSSV